MSARAAGFTLVETMVALFIFGLIAAAGVALLGFSARAQSAAGARLDEVAAIRRLGAILTADLAQAAPRLMRNADGSAAPAFLGGPGREGTLAMSLVRRGWDNPEGAPRASLQRVAYRLAGGRIERSAYPMIDGAEPRRPATVLRGVRSLAIRYRTRAGEWRDRWDPARPADLPRAVEVTVDLANLGPVRQVFLTGTGA